MKIPTEPIPKTPTVWQNEMNNSTGCRCISNEEAYRIFKEMEYEAKIQELEQKLKNITDKLSSPWISVNDRLPEPLEDVLVIDSNGNIFISWVREFGNGRFVYDNRGDITHITHWMPLPEPPKEEPGE